ncbi:hypothetical protein H310_13158 [Aphanomyces invadans]|uniref:Uncharacterized protein n=1 Tax=Aphanomyces invadans TaxID=157072 RepID=A0A024THA2_9STRA|nr:hypothetical protein H310_13158 [Aphanomyces invadans]ETV92737.1 hypothetical protein H310_13158 [Aphanomyces invadans]|eukprot:XP_008878773.1 hypothetical protein H310_13158 [Aphanomyces invadans]
MFLAAVARPRYDHHLKRMFDGKLGIWPFVKRIPATRNSKNRPKGTLVTTPLNVDAKVYTARFSTMSSPQSRPSFLVPVCNVVFSSNKTTQARTELCRRVLVANGVQSIGIADQLPNSPDFNVLV